MCAHRLYSATFSQYRVYRTRALEPGPYDASWENNWALWPLLDRKICGFDGPWQASSGQNVSGFTAASWVTSINPYSSVHRLRPPLGSITRSDVEEPTRWLQAERVIQSLQCKSCDIINYERWNLFITCSSLSDFNRNNEKDLQVEHQTPPKHSGGNNIFRHTQPSVCLFAVALKHLPSGLTLSLGSGSIWSSYLNPPPIGHHQMVRLMLLLYTDDLLLFSYKMIPQLDRKQRHDSSPKDEPNFSTGDAWWLVAV